MNLVARNVIDETVPAALAPGLAALATAITKLREQGYDAKVDNKRFGFDEHRRGCLHVNGEEIEYEIISDRHKNSWAYRSTARYTGRGRIKLGSYGNQIRFDLKKGAFDVDAIAQALASCVRNRVSGREAAAAAQARQDMATAAAERICKATGASIMHWSSNPVACYVENGSIVVRVRPGLTEEQALAVVRAIQGVLVGSKA